MLCWLRHATVFCVVCLFVVIAFPYSVSAAARYQVGNSGTARTSRLAYSSQDGITAVMLADADLPAGFLPNAPFTGPLNLKRGKILGINANSVRAFNSPKLAWVRCWVSARSGEGVCELAVDSGTRESAQAAIAPFESGALEAGYVKEPVAGPPGFIAFRINSLVRDIPYQNLKLSLARGPYLFVLYVVVPTRSSAQGSQLIGELATAQWRKVPNDTPDTLTSDARTPGFYVAQTISQAAGGFTGVVILYLGGVNFFAYLQNPLRGRRGRTSGRPQRPSEEYDIKDVSTVATNNKVQALVRFTLQAIGLLMVGVSVDVLSPLINLWYIYLLVGLALFWAAGRFIHPGGSRHTKNLAILYGSHRILVASLTAGASVIALLGLQMIIASVLRDATSQILAQATSQRGTANGPQELSGLWDWVGVALVALGAVIHRYGRRRGSIEAHRLMLRDARPPVLYLRSFGDDCLELWTATIGRPSFVERFSPGRFDTFEEVLVRYLSLRGPVIALNPPGTTLPPLGAARATLDSAQWQSTISKWMEQAAQIVFLAPPRKVTDGLLWELKRIATNKYWGKTLIIVPPVTMQALGRRWQAFLPACEAFWPSTFPLPPYEPSALVFSFRNNKWTMIIARRKSEWSYSAALEQILDHLP
jgi:hypothetical protein